VSHKLHDIFDNEAENKI